MSSLLFLYIDVPIYSVFFILSYKYLLEREPHASLLISMGENPLLIKERLGHEKIQTTLGTYGHLYPNTNIEIAKKLTGVLSYQSASQSIANYTSNQHTAMYHKEI